MDIIEVFNAGSTLAIIGGSTGIVEKIVIGANATVQYQLINYTPERHQVVCNDFECTPVEGKVSKCRIGFATAVAPEQKEVTILLDEDEKIVHVDGPDEVIVSMGKLTAGQVIEYRAIQMEKDNGKSEEKIEEGEEEKG